MENKDIANEQHLCFLLVGQIGLDLAKRICIGNYIISYFTCFRNF